ncbi:UPF0262 family protein [Bradyrhizobium sp. Arg314]
MKLDDSIGGNNQLKGGPSHNASTERFGLGLTQANRGSAEKASSSLCEVLLRGPFSRNEHVERERALAVAHLIQSNVFVPVGHDRGPYRLHLALHGEELTFQIATERRVNVTNHNISLIPMNKFLKHYVVTCENYYDAMPRAGIASLAKIDVARWALRDEGAEFLKRRLADKLVIDSDTARQLFTLVYVLFMRNTPAQGLASE